jgi:hypothetical protein
MEAVRAGDLIDDSIDLVKIDVEGHEMRALEGMADLLRRDRPIILTEANEYWLRTNGRTSADEYVAYLNGLGYRVFNEDNLSEPVEAGTLRLDLLDSINLVAAPEEGKDSFPV